MEKFNNFVEKAKKQEKETKKFLKKLNSPKKQKEVDRLFFSAHERAFKKIDCLTCANCCKTTGPLFTNKDIARISSKLRMKEFDFIQKYLQKDEDNDYVLQTLPCTFLDTDNTCSIYDYRPKACKEYPHTDRDKQHKIFHLTVKNCEICPAVFEVIEEVKKKYSV